MHLIDGHLIGVHLLQARVSYRHASLTGMHLLQACVLGCQIFQFGFLGEVSYTPPARDQSRKSCIRPHSIMWPKKDRTNLKFGKMHHDSLATNYMVSWEVFECAAFALSS
jgi:hypothetical protein